MSNQCRHGQLLSTYVDGELKASEARGLEEHLTACGACRLEFQNLQKLHGLLRQGLPDPALPVPLWPGVRSRIERGHPPGLLTSWISQGWELAWERPRLSFASAALTTFFILSVAYLLWESPVGKPPGEILPVGSATGEVLVEAVETEPGFRAMLLTTSQRGLKVIWVVARGDT